MKQLFTVFLLGLLISCGSLHHRNGNLKLVKSGSGEKIAVIEKETTQKVSRLTQDNFPKEENQEIQALANSSLEIINENQSTSARHKAYTNTPPATKIEKPQDLEPELSSEQIISQALRSEKNAKTAFGFSIGGLITLFVPYIGIIGIIFGFIFYTRAHNARFITPNGESKLKSARTLLFIDVLFLFFWILLIIFLIGFF